MARRIAYNAKVQRPGVCNAAETLLVHEAIASDFLPAVLADLAAAGVELVGDERTRGAAGDVAVGSRDRRRLGPRVPRAEDGGRRRRLARGWRSITSTGTAAATRRRSSPASEEAGDAFTGGVDAACVYVNASTRFTDGFEFGMGAEIGNSTQKLHARGPIGLRELTSTKYVLRGTGQTRG